MKYGNRKVKIDGITFDSSKEAQRYSELKLLQRAGLISGLETQKEFILIPAQFETVISKAGKTKQVCVERAVKYKADFAYRISTGEEVVEDTKGFKTKDYIIKRKLMLWVYGIKIVEV
jgi:hypothetical protein